MAKLLRLAEELFAQGNHSTFTLNHFNQKSTNAIGELLFETLDVGGRDETHPRHQRLERSTIFPGPRGRERPRRPPVKRILQSQHLKALKAAAPVLLARVGSGQLQRAFDGFRAAGGEEGSVEPCEPHQPLSYFRLIGMVDEVRDMKEGLRRITQNRENLRMGMAESIHRQSTEEVEVFLPFIVEEKAARSSHHHHREALVGGNQKVFLFLRHLFQVHGFRTIRVPSFSFPTIERHRTSGFCAPRIRISDTFLFSVRAQERSFGTMPSVTTFCRTSPPISFT